MGNIVEEIIKRNALEEGLIQAEKEKYLKTKKFIESKGVYNILKRTTIHLLSQNKPVDFHLYMDGGSYTDGNKIVVGVLKYAWGLPNNLVFSVLKALTGHETEHIESSDFDLFVHFQRDIGEDFENLIKTGKIGETIKDSSFSSSTQAKDEIVKDLQQASISKQYGAKLAAHLLNSVEDGRIEKRLGNRMKGYVKHIKFMNALVWENQPVTGQNPLQEFLFSITSLCVTGLKSKNWDKYYKGTELDDLLNKIRPLIIKGINEPTPQGCAEQTYKIYEIIAPKVAEMLKDDLDAMDEMSAQFNFSGTKPQQSQGGGNNFSGSSVSTHFTPEEPESEDESQNGDSNDGKQDSNGQGQSTSSDGENKDEKGNSSKGSPSDEDGVNANSSAESGDADGKGERSKDNDLNGQKPSGNSDEGNEEDGNKLADSQESNSNKGDKDENNLTDNSEQNARDEEELVKEFLNNAESELGKELENDMKQIKNEEAKIQREEERKKRESGDLSERELQDVLSGRGVKKFTQEIVTFVEQSLPDHIALPGKKLHRQLSEILMNKKGYNSRNRKRGVLDTTALWRLGVKEYNTFVKKGRPDNTSTVVSVLVDNSGSMMDYVNGTKTKLGYAQDACAVLEEGLKGLVPFRIQFFDDSSFGGVRHKVVSDFGDTEKVNRTYSSILHSGAANADGISIRIATKELLKRTEDRKILFVLSDGLPSSYYNETDAITSVQKAVRDARKEGVIVIAICFGSQSHLERTRNTYRKMYQKGIIMTEPHNIPMQLVKMLEREIK